MHPARRAILVLVLLVAGAGLWWVWGRGSGPSSLQLAMLALQAAVVSLPPINRWLVQQLDRIDNPSPRRRALAAIAVGCAGALYLYISALQQGRDRFPKFHDEYMHLLQ